MQLMKNKILTPLKYGSLVLFLIFTTASLEGCIAAAIGAGIGAAKWGSSKKKEAQAKQDRSYNDYLAQTHAINLKREKAGLKPVPVLSKRAYNAVD